MVSMQKKVYHISMKVKPVYIIALLVAFVGSLLILNARILNNGKPGEPSSNRIKGLLRNSSTATIYKDLIPETSALDKNPGYKTSPEFNIGQYVVRANLPSIPENASIYEFKSEFTDNEIAEISAKLIGDSTFTSSNNSGNVVTLSSDFGIVNFNRTSGAIQMKSIYVKVPFAIANPRDLSSIKEPLTTFMTDELGLIDATVTLTALYQRSEEPGVTYYEFHRSSENMGGLPIMNPVGVLNVAEKQPLSELKPGASEVRGATDTSIVYASDLPGKARQSEFNTMTAAISNDGYILSIESNIRHFKKVTTLTERGLELYDVKKALEELQRNGTYYNIAVPAGEGFIDLEKVYRNNRFVSDKAEVTDVVLAYLEKPADIDQQFLQPVYIVKGFAETETGVRVAFTQTIPALQNTQDSTTDNNSLFDKFLPKVYAQEENDDVITLPCDDGSTGNCRIIRRRITPTPTLPVTIPPTLVPPTAVPPLPSICVLLTKDGAQIEQGIPLFIPGLGTIYYFPTALPNGPLAIPKDQFTSTTDITFEKLHKALDNHLLSIAAERIIADPGMPYYVNTGSMLTSIKLNIIFPDANTNLDKEVTMSSYVGTGTIYPIKLGLYRLHHPVTNSLTLTQLRALPRIQGLIDNNIPISQIWSLKQNLKKAYSGASIYGQYQLTDVCKFASTVSPLIYFYPQRETKVSLSFLGSYVSYGDPVNDHNVRFWADTQGMLNFSGITRDRFHYEYKDVTFKRPTEGWVVNKEKVEAFLNEQFAFSGLIERERYGLLQEMRASLPKTTSYENVFIGILPRHEIDAKLPIHILPKPDHINRVHLYLEGTNMNVNITSAPSVPNVARDGYYIIETGVYVK